MQRPLATVVVFGVATATILTMLFVPALFKLFEVGAFRRQRVAGPESATQAS